MANVDRPRGFQVVKYDSNKVMECKVSSTLGIALAVGDAVRRTGASDADGVPYIEDLAATETNGLGILVGIQAIDEKNNYAYNATSYVPATGLLGDMTVTVCYDHNAELLVQEDSVGAALAAADVGLLIDLVAAGVDTATGNSGMEIDSSTAGISGQFKVVRLDRRPDNAIGNYADWIVTWAEHEDISDAVSV